MVTAVSECDLTLTAAARKLQFLLPVKTTLCLSARYCNCSRAVNLQQPSFTASSRLLTILTTTAATRKSFPCLVKKKVNQCFKKPEKTSSNVMFCSQPKDVQFTATEDERN